MAGQGDERGPPRPITRRQEIRIDPLPREDGRARDDKLVGTLHALAASLQALDGDIVDMKAEIFRLGGRVGALLDRLEHGQALAPSPAPPEPPRMRPRALSRPEVQEVAAELVDAVEEITGTHHHRFVPPPMPSMNSERVRELMSSEANRKLAKAARTRAEWWADLSKEIAKHVVIVLLTLVVGYGAGHCNGAHEALTTGAAAGGAAHEPAH